MAASGRISSPLCRGFDYISHCMDNTRRFSEREIMLDDIERGAVFLPKGAQTCRSVNFESGCEMLYIIYHMNC